MKRLIVVVWVIMGILPVQAENTLPMEFLAQGMRAAYVDDLAAYPDIPTYVADLRIEPRGNVANLIGIVTIHYTNTTPDVLDEVVIGLYTNLPSFGGNTRITNVMVDGVSVQPSLELIGAVAGLTLPEALSVGDSITIAMDYHLEVSQGRQRLYNQLSYLDNRLALASALPVLSVYDPNLGWWREVEHQRGDAVYSEIGNYDVTLTVPADYSVIATGKLVEVIETDDPTLASYRYAAPLVRDFSIMASPDYAVLTNQFEDITVNVYYLPEGTANADNTMQWALEALEAFTEAYGDYVYSELDVVQTLTTAGGIEYPGLIVVASNIWENGGLTLQVVTVHEVGHQWWYSMVGNNQVQFPWLDEALTDYSVAQYFKHIQGDAGYNGTINAFTEQYDAYLDDFGDQLIGLPASEYTTQAYGPIVYRKGGLFFDTIRQTIGDEAFLNALQIYLSTYRYQVATPADLQTIFEDVSSQELDDLFIEWVGYSN